jgi:hypothetical protein
MYAAGSSPAEIADELGLVPSTVYKRLKAAGVKLRKDEKRRPKSAGPKLRAVTKVPLSGLLCPVCGAPGVGDEFCSASHARLFHGVTPPKRMRARRAVQAVAG